MTDLEKIRDLTETLQAERTCLDMLVALVKSKDSSIIDDWNHNLIVLEASEMKKTEGQSSPARRIAHMYRRIFQRYLKK